MTPARNLYYNGTVEGRGTVQSLNVAQAAAILLHELSR